MINLGSVLEVKTSRVGVMLQFMRDVCLDDGVLDMVKPFHELSTPRWHGVHQSVTGVNNHLFELLVTVAAPAAV